MVAASALNAGDAPDWLRRWAAERVEPQVNWRAVLSGILHRRRAEVVGGKSDYTYRRPSRRSIALGAFRGSAYLPAMIYVPDTVRRLSPSLCLTIFCGGRCRIFRRRAIDGWLDLAVGRVCRIMPPLRPLAGGRAIVDSRRRRA